MTLVVTLTIRPEALASFTRFERIAAARMRVHGGALLHAVRIPPTGADPRLREVHVVEFPDETAFAAYRADAELAKHQALRALTGSRAAPAGTAPSPSPSPSPPPPPATAGAASSP